VAGPVGDQSPHSNISRLLQCHVQAIQILYNYLGLTADHIGLDLLLTTYILWRGKFALIESRVQPLQSDARAFIGKMSLEGCISLLLFLLSNFY